MKNIIRFLCAAMLLVSFAACEEKDNEIDNPGGGDNNTLATQLVGTWQSEHVLINGEEAHMQITIVLNANGTGKLAGMEESISWQVNGNAVTITNSNGNKLVYTITNITDEILVITGSTVPGTGQQAQFEGHFKKAGGGTPGDPDSGDLGIGTPELEDGTPTSLTVKAHVTGSVSQYLGQFPNYTCGVVWCSASDGTPTMNSNRIVCNTDSDGNFEATITGLTAGTSYTIVSWLKLTPESEAMLSAPRTYTTENGTNPDENWVDLGLPSGLLWATSNLRTSNSPVITGDFYAWGETQHKNNYDWNSYIHCNDGNYDQLTKYCNMSSQGYNGYTDNLTTLQAMDDAATVNLGNGARIPTKAEWQELIDYTTFEWVPNEGNCILTGPNGNSITLYARGYRDGYSHGLGSDAGYYWTATLCDWFPRNAEYFHFDSQGDTIRTIERNRGLYIRAVRAPQK